MAAQGAAKHLEEFAAEPRILQTLFDGYPGLLRNELQKLSRSPLSRHAINVIIGFSYCIFY